MAAVDVTARCLDRVVTAFGLILAVVATPANRTFAILLGDTRGMHLFQIVDEVFRFLLAHT